MVPEAVAGRDEPALCEMNLAPQGIAMSCTGHGHERLPGVLAPIHFDFANEGSRIAARDTAIAWIGAEVAAITT